MISGPLAADRLLLLGRRPVRTLLADLFHEFIGTDDARGARRSAGNSRRVGPAGTFSRKPHEVSWRARAIRFHHAARVGAAGLVKVRGPAIGGQLDGALNMPLSDMGLVTRWSLWSPCANGRNPRGFGHPGASFSCPPAATAGAARPWSRSSPLRPSTGDAQHLRRFGIVHPTKYRSFTSSAYAALFRELIQRLVNAKTSAGSESRPGQVIQFEPGAIDRPRVSAFAYGGTLDQDPAHGSPRGEECPAVQPGPGDRQAEIGLVH